MKSWITATVAALALAATPLAANAADNPNAGGTAGVLECQAIPGTRVNLLIHTSVGLKCTYTRNGVTERYKGETGIGLGLDLSFKDDQKFAFTVLAATSDVRPGSYALAGKYYGGELTAAAGVGVGAKALIGAGEKNISLQPIAVETSTGLGVSGGLSYLFLTPDK